MPTVNAKSHILIIEKGTENVFSAPFFLFSQDIEYSKQNISNTMTDTAAHREMWWKCFRPKKNCYCQFIQPFQTHTRFGLLMHPKEAVEYPSRAKAWLDGKQADAEEKLTTKIAKVNLFLCSNEYFLCMPRASVWCWLFGFLGALGDFAWDCFFFLLFVLVASTSKFDMGRPSKNA